jgi:HSP20 family protein
MPVGRKQRPSGRLWCPAADVYQTADGWIVKVDLAGVSPDDLEISIVGSTLQIRGCRRDTSCSECVSYHQLEITYSRFEKMLQFPCCIEGAEVRRDYQDGLLTLRLRCNSKDC